MMSNTPAISRTLGGADEFERRMRMVGQPSSSGQDPLAELARLVGQEDPFRGVFPQGGTAARPRTEPPRPVVAPQAQPVETYRHDVARHDDPYAAADHHDDEADYRASTEAGEEPGSPDDAAVVHGPAGTQPYPRLSVEGQRPIEQSPDAWAEGRIAPQQRGDMSGLSVTRDALEPVSGSSRRTLIVLAAVVLLTGGGLAASFLVRPSGVAQASSNAGTAAPTIMAAEGPSKVQPDNSAKDAEAASENSTLLDKNKGDGTATAQVVNTTEQPVDLAQAVKTAQPDDARPQASSPFPEPKKVKTVMVRPDGTIITNPADSLAASTRLGAATGLGYDQPASLAFDPQTSLPLAGQDQAPPSQSGQAQPAAQTPASAPAKAKSTTRAAAVTPKAPVEVADLGTTGTTATDASSTGPKARQAAAPVRAPKPKPTEVAAVDPADDAAPAATGAGGGYAVQLGAPPSEQDARETVARLQKKYAAQLGSYRPAIHKADLGTKSVYRIRVGNLSQEDAKSLCTKLTAGGGGCFVVRN
ncbi:SPOR domain-containing protein [Lichenihabitans psoromatis]|uniref:SPOR domain-containing protein n=1 Tax=Lichenihabitans psoromatis TaxID=2528642 RepID=UPI001035BB2B|nr:SPOR domain-containing protein [Lichenihabitans psoromatis]